MHRTELSRSFGEDYWSCRTEGEDASSPQPKFPIGKQDGILFDGLPGFLDTATIAKFQWFVPLVRLIRGKT